jgi:hypothetical protein
MSAQVWRGKGSHHTIDSVVSYDKDWVDRSVGTQTRVGRVTRANMNWLGWNDFSDAVGTFFEAGGYELEVCKLVVDGLRQFDPAFIIPTKSLLENPWDRKGHDANLTVQLAPLLDGNVTGSTE